MDLSIPASSLASLQYNISHKQVAFNIFLRFLNVKQKLKKQLAYGIAQERNVIEMLKDGGRNVDQVNSKAKDFDLLTLSATPDLIQDKGTLNERLIEIKCPYYLKVNSDIFDHKNKTIEDYYQKYQLQCHIQMYCFDCFDLEFIVYSDDKLHSMRVNFDPAVLYHNLKDMRLVWDHLTNYHEKLSLYQSLNDDATFLVFLKKEIDKMNLEYEIYLENINNLIKPNTDIQTEVGNIKFNKKNTNISY